MRGSSSSRYHSFISEAEWDKKTTTLCYSHSSTDTQLENNSFTENNHRPHLEHLGRTDSRGSSTGLLGASVRSLHQCLLALWKIKYRPSVTIDGHKRELHLHPNRISMPCSITIIHARPICFKSGWVALSIAYLFAVLQNKCNIYKEGSERFLRGSGMVYEHHKREAFLSKSTCVHSSTFSREAPAWLQA